MPSPPNSFWSGIPDRPSDEQRRTDDEDPGRPQHDLPRYDRTSPDAIRETGGLDHSPRDDTFGLENQDRPAGSLGSIAQSVRQTTEDLSRGQHELADVIQQAGTWIDGLVKKLEAIDVDRIANDVRALARRNPALFIGAALGIGMLAARMFRGAHEDRGQPTAAP
jgi:hypothetical protein